MEYRKRILSERLSLLINHFPVIALTGARQVGKTTFLKNLFNDWDYVVFDPVIDVENAREEPELFLQNHKCPLILDEIQYAPQLIPVIKRYVDKNKISGQFILTGSQQWSVMRNLTESLAGRAVLLNMKGFSLSEMSSLDEENLWLAQWLSEPKEFPLKSTDLLISPYSLTEQIFRGDLPDAQVIPLSVIRDFHNSYISTYIERDVRMMADITDLYQFNLFFRLTAALSAQEINYSQLGRDIGLTPQTAKRWLEILKGSFQWFQIPSYSGNTLKRITGKPKGYMGDTGLLAACQAISSPRSLMGHPLWGNIFETFVVNELLKQISVMANPPSVYHWRSHGGAEVDLILERDGILYPLEIKTTARPSRKHTSGIGSLRKTYPHLRIAPGGVICPCDRSIKLNETDYSIPLLSKLKEKEVYSNGKKETEHYHF